MARPIDWIATDPGSEPLTIPRLSIGQFIQQADVRLTYLNEMAQDLERLSRPFKGKGTILPVACKEAVSALIRVRECAGQFCELLNETTRMPIIFIAQRHDMLLRLYFIIDQAHRLEDRVENYRAICMSSEQGTHRRLIYEELQSIFQHISEMTQELRFQSHEARFQEQKLISLYEEA
jgi:hypothetical protein